MGDEILAIEAMIAEIEAAPLAVADTRIAELTNAIIRCEMRTEAAPDVSMIDHLIGLQEAVAADPLGWAEAELARLYEVLAMLQAQEVE
ncbi:MAG: hypothetical protein C0613_08280 [Desulfobulbaceae bacterium]|nr:MAG: hypothetical protein C0613_08280 [Desulfobulbaceae bacterium]